MAADPQPLSPAEYEAIAEAVMETSRGRWFLAEYARRNRQADTEMLLTAMARLENVVRVESAGGIERLRSELAAMAEAIAGAEAEIAAPGPSVAQGRLPAAAEGFDAVAAAIAAATADILAAAEQVQEVSWTLRGQGLVPEQCDALDACANAIHAGCALHDFADRGALTMIAALRGLEDRIAGIAGLPISDAVPAAPDAAPLQPEGCEPEPHQDAAPSDLAVSLAAMSEAEKLALFT